MHACTIWHRHCVQVSVDFEIIQGCVERSRYKKKKEEKHSSKNNAKHTAQVLSPRPVFPQRADCLPQRLTVRLNDTDGLAVLKKLMRLFAVSSSAVFVT